MKGLYYPSMLEVMTDGLKAFIWAEWDEQQKRYEIEHFNPGFRMGEWSEEFSVFGVNNHDRTDEITLGMINRGGRFFLLERVRNVSSPRRRMYLLNLFLTKSVADIVCLAQMARFMTP